MSHVRVEEIVRFMDTAFDGSRWHSILANLKDVAPEDYGWAPPGSGDDIGRSIQGMVRHLAAAKHVYHNQAFGDGTLRWPDIQPRLTNPDATMQDDLDWLHAGHRLLRASVAALEDDDLDTERPTHMGPLLPTRSIVSIMIEHDMYHAGEINHLRAIRPDTDYWAGARRQS